jgi:hypothetical protein
MLSGYMGSGKDTVGAMLRERGFRRLAFADAIKDRAARLYGLDRAALDTQEGKRRQIDLPDGTRCSVRRLLIDHAEAQRARDEGFWANILLETAKREGSCKIVVTDWRFPAEHAVLERAKNALNALLTTWRIERWSEPPLDDPSERALDAFPFDVVVENKGSLADLRRAVERASAAL